MTQTDIMLELLRSAVLDRTPDLPDDTVIDWDKLMDLSAAQSVLAWVWDGICKLPKGKQPPRLQTINWGLSAQEVWDKYDKQMKVLDKMVTLCAKNDIRLLLLKGIGLSRLFPKPESRPSSDIDIYLFENYERGNRLFTGHEVNRIDKHATFYIDDILIENHYNFFEPNTRQKRKIIKYLNASLEDVRLTNYGYYVFSPLAECVFLTLHTLKHFTEETLLPMKNVVDFAMYLNLYRNTIPIEQCHKILSDLSLEKGFEMLVCMSEAILGIELEDYHFIQMPKQDVLEINKIVHSDEYRTLSNQNPFFKRTEARCISKYIPRNSSFKGEIIHFFTSIVKIMFKIPSNISFKRWLFKRR